ncbi:MAG: SPFH domain-containing protein [Leptospiraceae bacterium]|nr:SPFH domain-containing protein [Leptospiraceae bacterium]MCP5498844.1 SPFH domain-containing protein [Leptospiraceae bacterium]
MGLWDVIKGEFIDVVEYEDNSQDVLVYKFDRQGNEIKNGAQLIVRPGQTAIFVNYGEGGSSAQLGDKFEQGRYELTTQNLPILSKLQAWKHGFNSPFKAEVYFVNSRLLTGQKWGTKNPITMRDADFGIVRVRAFGTYSIRISNPEGFITNLSGGSSSFDLDNLKDDLRSLVVNEFTDALGEMKIPVLDLASQYKELGGTIEGFLNKGFADLGLEVKRFLIENISLPPEVEAAIDQRGAMGALGVNYMQKAAADAMINASLNEGGAGGMMGAGMGMGAGMQMGNMMGQAFGGGQQQQAPGQAPPPPPGASQYYISVNGQQQGPFPMDQLKNMAANGQLTKQTYIWKQGMANWQAAGEVAEVSALFAQTPPPPPPPPPAG